jgi:hypothetical protein
VIYIRHFGGDKSDSPKLLAVTDIAGVLIKHSVSCDLPIKSKTGCEEWEEGILQVASKPCSRFRARAPDRRRIDEEPAWQLSPLCPLVYSRSLGWRSRYSLQE